MVSEADINKYVKAVSRRICCSKKEKSNCLSILRKAIEEISLQNEITDYVSLEAVLGSPRCVAKEFECNMDAQMVKRYRRKSLISKIAAILLIVGLLMGLYFYLIYNAVQPGYICESTINALQ